jgi:hypothetical protein
MNWHFRPLAVGEKTREPIQGEFFSTDAIHNPTEALVREGIQNTLDAANGDSVRVRILLASNSHAMAGKQAATWFTGAWDHLHAHGNGLREPPQPGEPCSFLVFEDFDTTGLQGDPAQPFDEPGEDNSFFYFFRAEGCSGKSETDRGRWGIGKHVFPRSSRLSTFFGLTVRADDSQRLLMGQTVLKSHRINGTHFSPDGYFGVIRPDKLVMPFKEVATLDQFCRDFRLARRNEPGLSVVVPWLDLDFTINHLKEAVVSGYFYPILTGALVVTIETPDEKVEVNAETLIDVALGLEGETGRELLPVVDLAEWAAFRPEQDFIKLNPCDPDRPAWSDELIPVEKLPAMRQALERGDILAIRASLTIREKGKPARPTHFDFFLRQDGYESGRPIFIRDGIIISDVRAPRARGVRSLVVIEDRPIATLLGDSENPAHTQWQRDSSNFKGKYVYGSTCLDFVTKAIASLVHALRALDEKPDPTLLLDFFSLPAPKEEEPPHRPEPRPKPKPGPEPPPDPDPNEPRKKRFRVQWVQGGFTITPGDAGTKPPARLDARVAYDLRRGNPLRKYHTADFRVNHTPIRFDPPPQGMKVTAKEENRISVEILDPNFRLTVVGFDEKRDLYVNVKMEETANDSPV